ncbi:hypothetical protein [Anatilimnocola floriformis]|uniref:hypothetical protein n=1 Tax=Anatilimnocola floriformis TaxID=2948575 RepID=UPI0020C4350A|nr:hypothetical protein [Anatilimnocola floriformis]
MPDAIRGLLFFGVAAVGWVFAHHSSELARKMARILPIVAGAGVCWLLLTGLVRNLVPHVDLHRWSGHAIVIFLWLAVPFAAGVVLERNWRRPSSMVILHFLALLAVLAIGLITAISGYLGPSNSAADGVAAMAEETAKRFDTLHKCVLPGVFSVLLVQWWRIFRPYD